MRNLDGGSGDISKVKIESLPEGNDEINDPNFHGICELVNANLAESESFALTIKAEHKYVDDYGPGEGSNVNIQEAGWIEGMKGEGNGSDQDERGPLEGTGRNQRIANRWCRRIR